MFDIGMPEFMIIGVVALVVLGPERLPEIMGKLGRGYSKLRNMSNEFMSEARAQWEDGMKEVESVSNTFTSTWEAATSDAEIKGPPPRLLQVDNSLQQAFIVVNAGPWALAAWHQQSTPDIEPVAGSYPPSLTALPRGATAAYDPAIDDAGGPSLMGPAPTAEELAEFAYDLPDELTSVESANGSVPDVPAQAEAPVPTSNGAHPHAAEAVSSVMDGPEPEGFDKERVIIDLYRTGGITAGNAARYLGVSEAEFLSWTELASSMDATRSA